jgi:hypothetical protein
LNGNGTLGLGGDEMQQMLIIFVIVFGSILALRRSWKIAARWGLLVAVVTSGLILSANALTLWYGILPKAENAVRNLGGPTDPHLLKAIAVPLAVLIYGTLGVAIRQLLLAYVTRRKFKFVIGFAGLYSLMQLFLAVADPNTAAMLKRAATPARPVRGSEVQPQKPPTPSSLLSPGSITTDTSKTVDRKTRERVTKRGQSTITEESASGERRDETVANNRPAESARLTAASPVGSLGLNTACAPSFDTNNKRGEGVRTPRGVDSVPIPKGATNQILRIPVIAESTASSRFTVALVIDSRGVDDPDWIADSLRDFLSTGHKVRIVSDVPADRSFFDGLYSGRQVARAMESSRADYLLIGKVRISFRRQSELDADLITCEMVSAVRLIDRSGTVLRSGVFPAMGPGFTQPQAFNGAAENTARQIANKILGTPP